MNEIFKYDFYRNTGNRYTLTKFIYWFIYDYRIRYLFFYRLKKRNIIKRLIMHKMARKYGLEIYNESGKGLYLGHAHNINVNPNAKIGKRCNLHKGVTIGIESRGKRKGTPTIGDSVWIGVNATIVGKIKIGNDVMIAPNSYVNCDIPSHSIVIGNPCIIKHKDNATDKYIINT